MRNFFYAAAIAALVVAAPDSAQMSQDRMATEAFAAASDGDVQTIAGYLDAGLDVNYLRNGRSLLSAAVTSKRIDAIRFLLDRGADPMITSFTPYVVGYDQPRPLIEYARKLGAPEVVALLEARIPAGSKAAARASPTTQPTQTQAASVVGQSGWPRAGDIAVGQDVLFSTSGGERWRAGVVTEIGGGNQAGMVKVLEDPNDGWSGGWSDPSYVVKPQREKFWTDFFVGDWDVNTGGAVNYRTDGRDVYQVVTGGAKMPPLRINADGTYQWREPDTRGKVVTGRWKPRDDMPGIVIMAGPRGTDWTLWNNTTRATRTIHKTEAIRVTGPVYSYDALRLSR